MGYLLIIMPFYIVFLMDVVYKYSPEGLRVLNYIGLMFIHAIIAHLTIYL